MIGLVLLPGKTLLTFSEDLPLIVSLFRSIVLSLRALRLLLVRYSFQGSGEGNEREVQRDVRQQITIITCARRIDNRLRVVQSGSQPHQHRESYGINIHFAVDSVAFDSYRPPRGRPSTS